MGITKNKILLLGYGSIGQALTPLLFAHFGVEAAQMSVMTADDAGMVVAHRYGVSYTNLTITEDNYSEILGAELAKGDWLINVSVEVSTVDLIEWCRHRGVFYLDTCVEPWKGGYDVEVAGSVGTTTNYALRHRALALRQPGAATAVIAHGANPGLITHFVKAGLTEMAAHAGYELNQNWAELARALGVAAIHIAERDTQTAHHLLAAGEFVNTWSIDGLLAEAGQRAELGWGRMRPAFQQAVVAMTTATEAVFIWGNAVLK